MKIKKCHKRYFQLLEVMIAAFILLVCAAPTLEVFTNMYREQQLIIRQNQVDHLAKRIHAFIVEKLYKREIPINNTTESLQYDIDDPEINQQINDMGYKAFYSLESKLKPKKRKEITKHLLNLTITIESKTPVKRFFAKEQLADRPYIYNTLIYMESENPDKTSLTDDVINQEEESQESEEPEEI